MHKKDNFQTDNFCIPAFKNVYYHLEFKACNTIRKILCIINYLWSNAGYQNTVDASKFNVNLETEIR